jgi:aspartyl-tRNA(Asn)/glutamyl-tRNA(Gln) amidotransferase subunit B
MVKEKEKPLKIGLEIHCYLNTVEKLFCKCSTDTGGQQNSNICPICTAQPGCKPMLVNREAVNKLIQVSCVLGCRVNSDAPLLFNRKHYNWADLPKGFQNTISGAHTKFPAEKGKFKGIGIWECHLEEDPAQWNPDSGHINYNRSGLPLVEVVTAPDFKSIDEVIFWLKSFLLSLSYIKAIRKNAGIKADVNVSTYGERVEMKNLNSLENIEKALHYEIARQYELYGEGGKVEQETRRYDVHSGKTSRMRGKENAADYRFVPDPDLPVIRLEKRRVAEIRSKLPETPDEKLDKLISKFKIDKKDAEILTRNLELVEFVEELAAEKIKVKENISWVTIELLRVLNYNRKSLDDVDVDVKPEHLALLIKAVGAGDVTPLKAKQIMNDFIPKSFSIAKQNDIGKIADDAVTNFAEKVIADNQKAVDDYRRGEANALNFLVGQVMRLSERRADFKTAREELVRLLED